MDTNRFFRDLRTWLVNMASLVGAGALGVLIACVCLKLQIGG